METNELIALGLRISTRRKQLHMTQETLAEKMNVSIQMISNLERGVKCPKITNIIKLSEILQTSTDYLLTGNDYASNAVTANRISQLSDHEKDIVNALIDFCLLTDKSKT
ncbi:MAG: helix-turn-helix transcriptional regulator [Lachnospiraceae bacterium]|nr:helix-turn-helix transcriptional regulator [Lachnospiraceae bacterium]